MNNGIVIKLIVREHNIQIKIEITPVLRGCVYEPRMLPVCDTIEEMFGFAEMQVVSEADLYAGKIMAGLDRQNPRDLFDIRDLLANEGISDELREAFLVYLMSHGRPMAEVLAARLKDIQQEFETNFVGMTQEPVSLGELLVARDAIVATMVGEMPAHHRQFLIDFEAGRPDWATLAVPEVKKLPAVKWRQVNFDKLDRNVRIENVGKLAEVLGVKPAPAQLNLFSDPKPNSSNRRLRTDDAKKTGKKASAVKPSKT